MESRNPTLWAELDPDPAMEAALNAADEAMIRSVAIQGRRADRHAWSNAFADACARMVAGRIRRHAAFRSLHVLPGVDGSAEPRTFVAGGKKKQIDVAVSSLVSGLQVGISMKGMNFRDAKGMQFDKNLTGRTYELQDEVRVVHQYQPAALLVGLFFVPLAATVDKKSENSASSFARTVEHLRARTGRLDTALPSQLDRLDMAAVCLYVPGDVEVLSDGSTYRDPFSRGVVRYFDVEHDPPFRGRPRLDTTWDLEGFVDAIALRYRTGDSQPIEWSEPEAD